MKRFLSTLLFISVSHNAFSFEVEYNTFYCYLSGQFSYEEYVAMNKGMQTM